MSPKPETKKKRALIKLGSSGQFTKPFEDLDDGVVSFFEREGILEDVGLPILAFFRHEQSWILVTSSHLSFSADSTWEALRWEEIKQIEIPSKYRGEIIERPETKLEINKLEVLCWSGDSFILTCEPGYIFQGMLSVLTLLAGPFGRGP